MLCSLSLGGRRTGAIIIGLTHALLPYTVLTIMGSLNGINPNLEQAAMIDGRPTSLRLLWGEQRLQPLLEGGRA